MRRGERERNVIELQSHPRGVAAGLRSTLCAGRVEIVPAGLDPTLGLVGGDPWNTNVMTGVQVPSLPTAALAALHPSVPQSQLRYLFLLARAQFNSGDVGTRLTGIRLYAELVARIPSEGAPDTVFRHEIVRPLFRPPDGSLTFHVMVIAKTQMARRSVDSADGAVFRDSYGPALLFESIAIPAGSSYPALTDYVPPNGARPWGKPIGASLGNMHDLRYRWRYSDIEQTLDIPLPQPCDVALFASVRQNDPTTNPSDSGLSANQFAALEKEDQFLTAYHAYAQYGRIAGSLVFNQNLGEDVP
jgi:hypothetical protein